MSELYVHRARKRFGQNFLHDAGVIHRILRAIHAKAGQHLLEIGPGQGALTEGLIGSGAKLDVIELDQDLVPLLKGRVRPAERAFAYHPPCTLQHGQKLRGGVERHMAALGFELRVARTESHLCCGSAGTYSVLQAALSGQLLERKLGHLGALQPVVITSANIGCITHLQSGTETPVRHWVQVLDEALAA